MAGVYDNPEYYEIGFSFRDIAREVDLFEECFRRFSRVPVRSVLELGCGNSPHMEELSARGYQYHGLDQNRLMLQYARQKSRRIGANVKLFRRDMVAFSLRMKVDFVYVLLGSLHARNTKELRSHFDSVAKVLRNGGLYLLDWCVQYESPWAQEGGETWHMKREGVHVKVTVSWKVVDPVEQTFEETIALEVDDHGKCLTLEEKEIKRAIYPQEFLCIISSSGAFEFVGWWNNWDLSQPLEKAARIDRPIALLRRL